MEIDLLLLAQTSVLLQSPLLSGVACRFCQIGSLKIPLNRSELGVLIDLIFFLLRSYLKIGSAILHENPKRTISDDLQVFAEFDHPLNEQSEAIYSALQQCNFRRAGFVEGGRVNRDGEQIAVELLTLDSLSDYTSID